MTDALIDTTFFIDLRRGHHAGANELWDRIQRGDIVASFCAISIIELWKGRLMNREEESFYEAILEVLSDEPITTPAAKNAGLWLRSLSEEISEQLIRDAMIAAVAAERSVPVYTANQRHFLRFPIQVLQY